MDKPEEHWAILYSIIPEEAVRLDGKGTQVMTLAGSHGFPVAIHVESASPNEAILVEKPSHPHLSWQSRNPRSGRGPTGSAGPPYLSGEQNERRDFKRVFIYKFIQSRTSNRNELVRKQMFVCSMVWPLIFAFRCVKFCFIIPPSTSDDTGGPQPDARIGSLHCPPGLRSSAPVSGCGGRPWQTDSSDSWPNASSPGLHPVIYKTFAPPRRAYRHCTRWSTIPLLRTVDFGCPWRPAPVREWIRSFHPCGHRSIFHIPPAAPRYGCRSDPEWGRKCAFDIS